MQTLGITMRFAGNYALSGLSPQIDDMPVIPKNSGIENLSLIKNLVDFYLPTRFDKEPKKLDPYLNWAFYSY